MPRIISSSGRRRWDRAPARGVVALAAAHLRHRTLLKGRDIRSVAALLGHSSVNTTMVYTGQQTLDLVREAEEAEPGSLTAVQGAA
jgi:integrase